MLRDYVRIEEKIKNAVATEPTEFIKLTILTRSDYILNMHLTCLIINVENKRRNQYTRLIFDEVELNNKEDKNDNKIKYEYLLKYDKNKKFEIVQYKDI